MSTEQQAWYDSLTPEQRERVDACWCGSVAALMQGRTSWVRMDVICPVCDPAPEGER